MLYVSSFSGQGRSEYNRSNPLIFNSIGESFWILEWIHVHGLFCCDGLSSEEWDAAAEAGSTPSSLSKRSHGQSWGCGLLGAVPRSSIPPPRRPPFPVHITFHRKIRLSRLWCMVTRTPVPSLLVRLPLAYPTSARKFGHNRKRRCNPHTKSLPSVRSPVKQTNESKKAEK